jgi:GxxExxY protein
LEYNGPDTRPSFLFAFVVVFGKAAGTRIPVRAGTTTDLGYNEPDTRSSFLSSFVVVFGKAAGTRIPVRAGTTTDLGYNEPDTVFVPFLIRCSIQTEELIGNMSKLIHPELSYLVRGVLMDVHRTLGPMLKEEYYRDAIAIGLEDQGLSCETEKSFEVYYRDERVGLYFVDVWVEGGKILLEIKVAQAIEPLHKAQALSYLKVTDADLAIVVNYGGPSLKDVRMPNFLRDRQAEFVWQPQPAAEGLLYADLVNDIQRACHRVHLTLGPGFLHQIYRRATMIELRHSGLSYDYIKRQPVVYHGQLLGYQDTRLILVEGKVLLATFALRHPKEVLIQKMKAHLRHQEIELGLLANFYFSRLEVTPVRV